MIRAIYRAVVHLAAVLASFVFPLGLRVAVRPPRNGLHSSHPHTRN